MGIGEIVRNSFIALEIKHNRNQLEEVIEYIEEEFNPDALILTIEELKSIKSEKSIRQPSWSPNIDTYTELYESHLGKRVTPTCTLCGSSGRVKVVLLHLIYHNRRKTWIFDFNSPQEQWSFLQKHLKGGGTFNATPSNLPCRCENGNEKNILRKNIWLSPKQRSLAGSRCIHVKSTDKLEANHIENYYQAQTVKQINEYAQGRIYKIKPIEKYPETEQLIKEFSESLYKIRTKE